MRKTTSAFSCLTHLLHRLARALEQLDGRYDYVLIARAETATRDYADLRSDVRFALKRLRLLQRAAA